MVWEALRPRDAVEEDLVERLAQATWGRMRPFRARARQEILMWRRPQSRAGQTQRLSLEETERRVRVISRRLDESGSIEDQTFPLEKRIRELLDGLVASRAVDAEAGDQEPRGAEL